MPFPSKYPPDLIDAVVQRVAEARQVRAYGAVTSVARQMNLDPRLVQKWITKASAPRPPEPGRQVPGTADPGETYLPPGLLHCRFCHQPMACVERHGPGQGYQCQQDCRPRPVDAAAIAHTVGRTILRHAAQLIPATGAPTLPHLAAVHAHRVLARVTVGANPTDITLTWRAAPRPVADQLDAKRVQRVATARNLALNDPLRARQLLHDSLTGVDPATAPAHPLHAEAAARLAELQLRLGHPTDAITWATYAHHATTHLHGPTHPRSLHALHLHATAHRRAGHHQRAYHLYRQLADHLSKIEGRQGPRTLAVHATIALVLHALGHCQAARTLLADTITTHRREHPGHPATARMTRHLSRIWRDCAAKGHQHHEDS
ncbi:CDC27 family protein [Micromonospora yasonensis]|uniref:CDC27 family protein n=1 Tax=Micromonospora yasonensis TaxID=1128667 RepID=UPI002231B823|nr:CDC27 family protein [Micromonospora yasonensis]MCW3841659.1 CDC27 family protein [Micromonospora yasonensis]